MNFTLSLSKTIHQIQQQLWEDLQFPQKGPGQDSLQKPNQFI